MNDSLKHFVPFGGPSFGQAAERAVLSTLRSGWIGMGPRTQRFERDFARYVRSRYAIAVSSCTAALHASLVAAGLKRGDEVITSPLTFVATANAILLAGGCVRFADVDPSTYNISAATAEKAITPRTRFIIPVHFGGLPADLDALKAIARPRKIQIIEDAAHAVGARYRGRMVGASGDLVCFSFYANKNITTVDGGMITTPSRRLAERLRILRIHGLDADAWKRFSRRSLRVSLATAAGYKYNLNDVNAAIGIEQLKRVEEWQRKREAYANIYDRMFAAIPGVIRQYRPLDVKTNRHALHLYTLQLDKRVFGHARDRVVQALLRRNIGASIHYYPVHLHPHYRAQGYRREDFPIAERISDQIFSLPLTPHLLRKDISSIGAITAGVIRQQMKR